MDELEEIEIKDFKFKQLTKVKVNDAFEHANERCSLLCVSNEFGLTFLACDEGVFVFRTNILYEVDRDESLKDNAKRSCLNGSVLPTPSPPVDISLSSDGLTLLVCITEEDRLKCLFFDTRVLNSPKGNEKVPFTSIVPVTEKGTRLCGLQWNPNLEHSDLLVLSLSTGSLLLLLVKDDVRVLSSNDKVNAISVCWSPKGKQIAVGRNNGDVLQLSVKANIFETKKSYPCPDIFNGVIMQVSDIFWASTYVFALVYSPLSRSDDGGDNTPASVFLTTSKDAPPVFSNATDVYYGSGRNKNKFFFSFLSKWGILISSSSNSMDTVVFFQDTNKKGVWKKCELEDTGRAECPLDKVTNEESFSRGMMIDYSSKQSVVINDALSLPPCPLLLLLSNHGVLTPFTIVNTRCPTSDLKEMVTPPKPLPNTPFRKVKVTTSQGNAAIARSTNVVATPTSAPVVATPTPGTGLFAPQQTSSSGGGSGSLSNLFTAPPSGQLPLSSSGPGPFINSTLPGLLRPLGTTGTPGLVRPPSAQLTGTPGLVRPPSAQLTGTPGLVGPPSAQPTGIPGLVRPTGPPLGGPPPQYFSRPPARPLLVQPPSIEPLKLPLQPQMYGASQLPLTQVQRSTRPPESGGSVPPRQPLPSSAYLQPRSLVSGALQLEAPLLSSTPLVQTVPSNRIMPVPSVAAVSSLRGQTGGGSVVYSVSGVNNPKPSGEATHRDPAHNEAPPPGNDDLALGDEVDGDFPSLMQDGIEDFSDVIEELKATMSDVFGEWEEERGRARERDEVYVKGLGGVDDLRGVEEETREVQGEVRTVKDKFDEMKSQCEQIEEDILKEFELMEYTKGELSKRTNRHYTSLQKLQPLDPTTSERLNTIRTLFIQVSQSLDDVLSELDNQLERIYEERRQKGRDPLKEPSLLVIYSTLKDHHRICRLQNAELDSLTNRMKQLRLVPNSWYPRDVSTTRSPPTNTPTSKSPTATTSSPRHRSPPGRLAGKDPLEWVRTPGRGEAKERRRRRRNTPLSSNESGVTEEKMERLREYFDNVTLPPVRVISTAPRYKLSPESRSARASNAPPSGPGGDYPDVGSSHSIPSVLSSNSYSDFSNSGSASVLPQDSRASNEMPGGWGRMAVHQNPTMSGFGRSQDLNVSASLTARSTTGIGASLANTGVGASLTTRTTTGVGASLATRTTTGIGASLATRTTTGVGASLTTGIGASLATSATTGTVHYKPQGVFLQSRSVPPQNEPPAPFPNVSKVEVLPHSSPGAGQPNHAGLSSFKVASGPPLALFPQTDGGGGHVLHGSFPQLSVSSSSTFGETDLRRTTRSDNLSSGGGGGGGDSGGRIILKSSVSVPNVNSGVSLPSDSGKATSSELTRLLSSPPTGMTTVSTKSGGGGGGGGSGSSGGGGGNSCGGSSGSNGSSGGGGGSGSGGSGGSISIGGISISSISGGKAGMTAPPGAFNIGSTGGSSLSSPFQNTLNLSKPTTSSAPTMSFPSSSMFLKSTGLSLDTPPSTTTSAPSIAAPFPKFGSPAGSSPFTFNPAMFPTNLFTIPSVSTPLATSRAAGSLVTSAGGGGGTPSTSRPLFGTGSLATSAGGGGGTSSTSHPLFGTGSLATSAGGGCGTFPLFGTGSLATSAGGGGGTPSTSHPLFGTGSLATSAGGGGGTPSTSHPLFGTGSLATSAGGGGTPTTSLPLFGTGSSVTSAGGGGGTPSTSLPLFGTGSSVTSAGGGGGTPTTSLPLFGTGSSVTSAGGGGGTPSTSLPLFGTGSSVTSAGGGGGTPSTSLPLFGTGSSVTSAGGGGGTPSTSLPLFGTGSSVTSAGGGGGTPSTSLPLFGTGSSVTSAGGGGGTPSTSLPLFGTGSSVTSAGGGGGTPSTSLPLFGTGSSVTSAGGGGSTPSTSLPLFGTGSSVTSAGGGIGSGTKMSSEKTAKSLSMPMCSTNTSIGTPTSLTATSSASTSAPLSSATSAPVSSATTSAPVSLAPLSSATTSAPVSLTPVSSATTSAPVSLAPVSSATTSAPVSLAPVSSATTSAPVSLAPVPSATTSAPVSLTPVSSATTSAPVSLAPVSSATTSAPVSLAPVYFATTSAPVSLTPVSSTTSAPVSLAPVPSATTSAPVSLTPVSSATTSAPVSLAPVSSATTSAPVSLAPVYSATTSAPISSTVGEKGPSPGNKVDPVAPISVPPPLSSSSPPLPTTITAPSIVSPHVTPPTTTHPPTAPPTAMPPPTAPPTTAHPSTAPPTAMPPPTTTAPPTAMPPSSLPTPISLPANSSLPPPPPLQVGNLNIKEVASSIQDGEEEEEEAMADDMDSTNVDSMDGFGLGGKPINSPSVNPFGNPSSPFGTARPATSSQGIFKPPSLGTISTSLVQSSLGGGGSGGGGSYGGAQTSGFFGSRPSFGSNPSFASNPSFGSRPPLATGGLFGGAQNNGSFLSGGDNSLSFGSLSNQNTGVFGSGASGSTFGGSGGASGSTFGGAGGASGSTFGGAGGASGSTFGGAGGASGSTFGGVGGASGGTFGGIGGDSGSGFGGNAAGFGGGSSSNFPINSDMSGASFQSWRK